MALIATPLHVPYVISLRAESGAGVNLASSFFDTSSVVSLSLPKPSGKAGRAAYLIIFLLFGLATPTGATNEGEMVLDSKDAW